LHTKAIFCLFLLFVFLYCKLTLFISSRAETPPRQKGKAPLISPEDDICTNEEDNHDDALHIRYVDL